MPTKDMKITVVFDVEFFGSTDPDKLSRAFVDYLYDMLYVGVDYEQGDPFAINSATLHLYEVA